jgi:tRNA1(Val) A37 N6-methylase TrmN6
VIATQQANRAPDRTVDAFLGGRVRLVQPSKGHRAGLDAALLQALVPAATEGRAVDLGAGVGSVAFCLAARATNLSVLGIEFDPGLVECGRDALKLRENSRFAKRVQMIEADVTTDATRNLLGPRSADWVLMNPPFDPEGRGSRSADRLRRIAHVAPAGTLRAWCATAATLLKPAGTLGLIHRADAIAEVLDSIGGKFGDARILPVHPTESEAAIRILVTARLGSRAPPALLPGLVLHQPGGAWTPRADAILRGQAELATLARH